MKFNWKAGLAIMAIGVFCEACGYIGGHATAMHQHASTQETSKMFLNDKGEISSKKYIIEAFKDFKRMRDDPLGLKRELI